MKLNKDSSHITVSWTSDVLEDFITSMGEVDDAETRPDRYVVCAHVLLLLVTIIIIIIIIILILIIIIIIIIINITTIVIVITPSYPTCPR